jgi:hypothetical protein
MNNTFNNRGGTLVRKRRQNTKASLVKPLPFWFIQALEVARATGFAIPKKWKTELPVIQF